MAYRLLDRFQATFAGTRYRHRNSSLGNQIANYLYDDLYELGHSSVYQSRVDLHTHVLNRRARSPGVRARRGDGSFGTLVPNAEAAIVPGFIVASGPTATVQVGVETKILAKAMIKQIDRVITDLKNQADQFRHKNPKAVTVAIVGVNHARRCVSYEKDRVYPTDGKGFPHPIQEAEDAKSRLRVDAEPAFDEFIILEYIATNEDPYEFEWVSSKRADAEYGSALVRILDLYEARFP